ncbi:nucleoside recognition domain-containing protein [Helicovermis profundi]|uniref:Nucleoside recognition protein n=1 Tax=Helicovermis profundi TaxID=3065157 RepID=A0AAU9E1H0_9FIRM|nr:nucleoside recognition protein [Clostridia bacterium S502]
MFYLSVKNGIKKGIETTIMLAKVLVPVYFVVTFLKYTPLLDFVAKFFEPLMKIFGLPGEAAIVLVLGNFINIYAAIGAITALTLNIYQITTLGLMISISHSLLVETAIIKKVGAKGWKVVLTRISISLLCGLIMGLIGGGI